MADRRYETLVLIHPEQGEPGSKELAARIRTLIEEQGGTVSQVQSGDSATWPSSSRSNGGRSTSCSNIARRRRRYGRSSAT